LADGRSPPAQPDAAGPGLAVSRPSPTSPDLSADASGYYIRTSSHQDVARVAFGGDIKLPREGAPSLKPATSMATGTDP
jgi:hypothetical protein